MDLGPQTLSLFLMVFVILVAMGVALVVDLLKGNNEQLRELAIELKAKKESAERHLQVLETHTAHLLQQPALASGPGATQSLLEQQQQQQSIASDAVSRKPREEGVPKREMSPGVAAVAQAVEARMAAGRAAHYTKPVKEQEQMPDEVMVPAAAAAFAMGGIDLKTGAFQIDNTKHNETKKDWSRILSTKKQQQEAPVVEAAPAADVEMAAASISNLLHFDAVRGPVTVEDSGLPAGFHDAAILRKAAELGKVADGMVVSIGLNQMDRAQMVEVSQFVQSLLQPADFGCQSGSDEFVLVCSTESQSAQRRLSDIAERLWDFQLNSMGTLNVQFAWGGMEARGHEKLSDVVATAVDQMTETRRARRSSTVRIATAV